MSEARKVMRRLHNISGCGPVGFGSMIGGANSQSLNEALKADLDRRRQYFAEELVKLGIEGLSYGHFSDTQEEVHVEGKDCTTIKPVLTMEGWFLALTKAAKSAAEEMYPELPEEEV